MAKNATKTKARVVHGKVKVQVSSAPGVVPDGKVQLSLRGFKKLVTLKNGKAKVRLPKKLEPGTYKLKVSYAGSVGFEPSKSKKVKVTVR